MAKQVKQRLPARASIARRVPAQSEGIRDHDSDWQSGQAQGAVIVCVCIYCRQAVQPCPTWQSMVFKYLCPLSFGLPSSHTLFSNHLAAHPTLHCCSQPNNMAKPKSTKSTSYTDEEVAFIIFYADYCLHSGAEYKKTLATELEKVSGRSRSWSALRTKIKSIVGQYGKIATQTPAGFIEQGTACLNMDELPADVVDEILSQRAEWGFVTSDSDGIASPKRAASAMDESIVGITSYASSAG